MPKQKPPVNRISRRRVPVAALMAVATIVLPARAQSPPPSQATYQVEQGRARIVLAPLPHDVVRAFYIGRGFEKPFVEQLVRQGCVYRLDVGNVAEAPDKAPLSLDLTHWKIRIVDGFQPMPLKDRWLARFKEQGMAEPQRIALRWATFPNQQTFYAGDYNWGMMVLSQPPGTVFDLEIRWRDASHDKTHRLEGMKCASF